MERLARRIESGSGIKLDWEDSALNYLAERGYDPAYGARPLKRFIQNQVETPLSRMMVKGEIEPRQTISLRGTGEGLLFDIKKG